MLAIRVKVTSEERKPVGQLLSELVHEPIERRRRRAFDADTATMRAVDRGMSQFLGLA